MVIAIIAWNTVAWGLRQDPPHWHGDDQHRNRRFYGRHRQVHDSGVSPPVLSCVDAGWTPIVLNLIPVFGLLSAISLLGEKLSRGSGIGALLVGASVIYFTICDQRGSHGTVDAPQLTSASRERARTANASHPITVCHS